MESEHQTGVKTLHKEKILKYIDLIYFNLKNSKIMAYLRILNQ